MSRFVDSIIAYRILRMLTTPFTDTDAYRLGIIDANGKELKKMSTLNSADEKDAYSILHRMVYRIKRIIEKVPTDSRKLATFAAALALIKEHAEAKYEPVDLELQYLNKLNEDLTEEIRYVRENLTTNKMFTFKMFVEEGEGAPANNAVATPGIDGFTPETMGVRKKKPPLLKRKEVINATSSN